MKETKLQIRIEPETKERWLKLASESGKTLTQYIVDSIEGAVVEPAKVKEEPVVRVKIKRGAKELPSQETDGFITYFK